MSVFVIAENVLTPNMIPEDPNGWDLLPDVIIKRIGFFDNKETADKFAKEACVAEPVPGHLKLIWENMGIGPRFYALEIPANDRTVAEMMVTPDPYMALKLSQEWHMIDDWWNNSTLDQRESMGLSKLPCAGRLVEDWFDALNQTAQWEVIEFLRGRELPEPPDESPLHKPCCDKEDRSMAGGCKNCGDPCL